MISKAPPSARRCGAPRLSAAAPALPRWCGTRPTPHGRCGAPRLSAAAPALPVLVGSPSAALPPAGRRPSRGSVVAVGAVSPATVRHGPRSGVLAACARRSTAPPTPQGGVVAALFLLAYASEVKRYALFGLGRLPLVAALAARPLAVRHQPRP